jgi:hypothetical protein
MISPTYALVWEQWRRTRVAIALTLLVPFGLMAIAALFDQEFPLEVIVILGGWALGFLVLYLALFDSAGGDVQLGFPSLVYRLPMRTHRLVRAHLAYRVAAVLAVCFFYGIGGTVSNLGRLEPIGMELEEFLAAIAALGICFTTALLYLLAMSWTVGARSNTLAMVVAVGVGIPLFLLLVSLIDLKPGAGFLAVIGIAVVSGGAAVWGGIRNRSCAGIAPPNPFAKFWSRSRTADAAVLDQPLTQPWFQWRTRARNYFWVITLLTVLVWGMTMVDNDPTGRSIWQRTAWTVSLIPLVLMPLIAAVMGAMFFMQDRRDVRGGLALFTLTRPLDTHALAVAQLKATAKGVALAALVPGALFLAINAWLLTYGLPTRSAATLEIAVVDLPWSIVMPQLATAAVCVAISWVVLNIHFLLPAWLITAFLTALVAGFSYSGQYSSALVERIGLLWFPAMVIALASIAFSYITWRDRLLSQRVLVGTWLAWVPLAVVILVILAPRLHPALRSLREMFWIQSSQSTTEVTLLLLAFSLLPVLAVVYQPLYIRWLRHR